MVRVRLSHAGYGELVWHADSGWGNAIHAVGLEDSLFDPDTVLRPEIEMRAQTIHHDYRSVKRKEYLKASGDRPGQQRIMNETANCPWHRLSPGDKEQNRQLAAKYDEYLDMVIPGRKSARYRRKFSPIQSGHLWAERAAISRRELDALAEVEHVRWLDLKRRRGSRSAKTERRIKIHS